MTPFGRKLRELRAHRGVTLKSIANAVGVSAAYLSALDHGHRGVPAWYLVPRIIAYFNIIWDEAEELEHLAQRSSPRVVVDTSGLLPEATKFANRLARDVCVLNESDLKMLQLTLDRIMEKHNRAFADRAEMIDLFPELVNV